VLGRSQEALKAIYTLAYARVQGEGLKLDGEKNL